jgi:DNA-directed RNA polymerase sigma subunit (sigma70/sigma32)
VPPDRSAAGRRGAIGLIKIRPPLTREEEHELHVLIAEGRQAAAELDDGEEWSSERRTVLRRRVRRGREAEEELLAGTCGLVKKRVNDLGFAFDQDELEAAGLEGLVRALREFDPSRGVRFATYANYWISKMVTGAISNRVPYPDRDLRLVIKYRRLLSQMNGRTPSSNEVAKTLGLSRADAARVARMSADISSGMASFDPDIAAAPAAAPSSPAEAEWVIDVLQEILGEDFADFWLWTGKVMSLEQLGRKNHVSKQAMAKRAAKWRRLVEQSPHADRMVAWLRDQ